MPAAGVEKGRRKPFRQNTDYACRGRHSSYLGTRVQFPPPPLDVKLTGQHNDATGHAMSVARGVLWSQVAACATVPHSGHFPAVARRS